MAFMPFENNNAGMLCYTVDDIRKMLGVSRPTVYKLLEKKEFHWFRIGDRHYRIPKKSFDEWLNNQRNR